MIDEGVEIKADICYEKIYLMVVPLLMWILPAIMHISQLFALPATGGICEDSSKIIHPFYVSVTEFNYNQKENVLEISCKMFADDFETTLKTQYKTAIDITHPKDPKQVEKLAYDYLQKHLQLKINAKAVNYQFIGWEKENEAVWCYLQVNNVTAVKKLEVTNNLLYEMYNTQISIMHASVGGNRKSTRLEFPDTFASFEW